MYPFLGWPHSELVDRLGRLIDDGYEIEAVVASAQTIEQGLKRIIVREMNTSRRGVKRANGTLSIVRLNSTDDRNRAVRCLASLHGIDVAWSLLFAGRDYADLSKTVDSAAGTGSWPLLSTKDPVIQPRLSGVTCIGLFELRHRLVHGWHLPPKHLIGKLAPAGRDLVNELFGSHGIAPKVGYDPFTKMPRFRAAA